MTSAYFQMADVRLFALSDEGETEITGRGGDDSIQSSREAIQIFDFNKLKKDQWHSSQMPVRTSSQF